MFPQPHSDLLRRAQLYTAAAGLIKNCASAPISALSQVGVFEPGFSPALVLTCAPGRPTSYSTLPVGSVARHLRSLRRLGFALGARVTNRRGAASGNSPLQASFSYAFPY